MFEVYPGRFASSGRFRTSERNALALGEEAGMRIVQTLGHFTHNPAPLPDGESPSQHALAYQAELDLYDLTRVATCFESFSFRHD